MFNEIYEILSEYYDSKSDALFTIKEFLESIEDKKGKYNILNSFEETALELDLCPNCLVSLTIKNELLNIHEAWGRPVEEWGTIRYCPECGVEY